MDSFVLTSWQQRRDVRLHAFGIRLQAQFLRQAAQVARGRARATRDVAAWEAELRVGSGPRP